MQSRARQAAILVLLSCLAPLAQAEARGGESGVAIAALLDAEKILLEGDLQRFRSLARRRSEAAAQVERLHQSLDAAMGSGPELDPYRIERLMDQVHGAERSRDAWISAQREVVDRVADRLKRMALIEGKLAEMAQEDDEREAGGLNGEWEMTLMPIGLRGSAELVQTGAVVNGTYRFDGGWSGSLQGTLVQRKVFMVRIDSQLGKSMELEGYLSADGNRIRGTWQNYELAGAEGSTGEWVARRKGADGR